MRILLFLLCFLFISPSFAFDLGGPERITINYQADVSVTTTSTQFLAEKRTRRYLLIVNKGTTGILLKFDSAHAAAEGIIIPAGGNYEPFQVPLNSIYLVAVSGTNTVAITEGI